MSRSIIKIKDKYFEWSTISNSLCTYGLSLEELKEYIKEEYGNEGMGDLPDRLERVDKVGTSFYGRTLETVLSCNRAGEDETEITADEIYERYKMPIGEEE